ncbi:MAG: matrixin family metalloprotease [Pseudomonadota bacterium]
MIFEFYANSLMQMGSDGMGNIHKHLNRTCGVRLPQIGLESSTGSGANVAWPHSPVSWRLVNTPAGVSFDDCSMELQSAFRTWEAVCPLRTNVSSRDSADIEIAFRSPGDFAELGNNAAIAFFPDSGALSGLVVFNSDQNWRLSELNNDQTQTKLFCYAVHEIGHAIGLKGHSGVGDHAMQAVPGNWSGDLSGDDISAAQSLYSGGSIPDV